MGHPTRVDVRLALLLLNQEADHTGNDRYRVTPATLRQWKARGHLSRGRGYDLVEIVDYLDRRSQPVAVSA